MMSRIPSLVPIGAGRPRGVAVLLLAALAAGTPAVAAEPEPPPDLPRDERAALRAESEVARLLARLDEELGLGTSPDASPEWPARLATVIEAREDSAPAQGLLRGLAAALRNLGVGRAIGGASIKANDARPELDTPEERARTETIARIGKRADLVLRKLHPPESGIRTDHQASGGLERITGSSNACPTADPLYVDSGINGSTSGATVDGDASCAGPVPTPDVWFRFTAPEDGSYSFYTQAPSYDPFDTVLSLHTGCPLAGGDTLEIACSDDAGGDLYSSISRAMSSGEQVWIRVSGYGGATGRYELRITEARTVRGTVIEEGSGESLAGIEIEVTDRLENYLFQGTSGPDGSYEVTVRRTSSDLVAHTIDEGHVTEWYDGWDCTYGTACSSPWDADAIDVDDADASGIDFTLAPAGMITGTVSAVDGNGDDISALVSLYDEDGGFLHSLPAELDGSYRLVGLPPGGYRLRATAADYRGEVWEGVPCSGCSILSGDVVRVAPGETVTGIDFTLDRLGSISGTVRQENEGPVWNGRVFVYRDDGIEVGSRYLDGSGDYELAGLEAGDYFVRVSSDDFRGELYDDQICDPDCDVTGGTPVSVGLNEDVTGIDFRLARKASIAGTVLEEGTDNVVSIQVMLFDETGNIVDSGTPSIAYGGRFGFAALDAGTYYVKAGYFPGVSAKTHADELWNDLPCPADCNPTNGTPIVLGASTQVTGIDVRVVPRGTIAGHVTSAATGGPFNEPVTVRAFFPDGAVAGSVQVGPTGTYEIRYLEEGSYRVGTASVFWKDEMYDGFPCGSPCDRTQGTSVSVENGIRTAGIDFALDRWGSIAGQVQAPLSSSTAGDLELFDQSGSLLRTQEVFFNPDSAPFEYLLTGLAAGTYFLKVDEQTTYERKLQAEVYDALACEPDCEVTDGTPVVVGEGEAVTGIDFRLAACSHDSRELLTSTTVDGYFKVLACDEIRANDTTLTSGATLALRSGRLVVLGDGFSMEPGAKLQVVIDPAWKTD